MKSQRAHLFRSPLLVLVWSLGVFGGVPGSEPNPGQPESALSTEQHLKVNIQNSVKFFLFTRTSPRGVVLDGITREKLVAKGFDDSLSTTVIIHGYGQSVKKDPLFTNIAGALLDTGASTNVLGVDWSKLCPKPFYLTSRRRVADVGAWVASAIDQLVAEGLARRPHIHVIGHSLGAHVAGNVGKATKVSRITGLDPAGPLFHGRSEDRLSPSDADLVDVIHTCIGALGIKDPLGDVDFYPNGGKMSQPGCTFMQDTLKFGHCSHTRAHELYAESIRDGKAFPAIECNSSEDALRKSCSSQSQSAFMGHSLQYSEPGVYYLETRKSSPFAFGSNQSQDF